MNTTMFATYAVKTARGDFHTVVVPDRTSVRHGLALQYENERAGETWDQTPMPYKNWGYENALAYQLANHEAFSRVKRGGKF